jgi:hypothetical protein
MRLAMLKCLSERLRSPELVGRDVDIATGPVVRHSVFYKPIKRIIGQQEFFGCRLKRRKT